MEHQAYRRIASPLAKRIGEGADAAKIAEATIAIWRDIDAALNPVIGHQGVAALYLRSLFLARRSRPWLASSDDGAQTSIDYAALESTFAKQSSSEAVAGGDLLFQTFHGLLTSLVGPSLTERLLRSAWANTTSGPSAMDTTP
jgi:hypothetical protein